MYKVCFFFLFFIICSFSTTNSNAYITSDSFLLDSENDVLILSNNVSLFSQSYEFNSNLVEYSLRKDVFDFYDNFSIFYQGQEIKGQNLQLNNKTKMLTANNILMFFDRFSIKGDKLKTAGDEYHLEGVKVSACEGDSPLFYLLSSHMTMHPKQGFMVVFNTFFYIYNIPVFYLPAYFIGGSDFSKVSEFIPEIGSNAVEGNFIKERIPYYFNREHNGSFFFGYLENFGIKIGLDHYTILGQKQLLKSSYYYNALLSEGGLEYTYDFIQNKDETGYLFWYLFDNQSTDSLIFTAKWYENQLLSDRFVTQKPQLRVDSKFALDDISSVVTAIEYSNLEELDYFKSTSVSSWKKHLELSLLSDFKIENFLISNKLSAVLAYYSNINHQRYYDNFTVSFPYSIFDFSLGSQFMLGFTGNSPFEHDMADLSKENKWVYHIKATFPYFIFEYDVTQEWSGKFLSRKYTLRLPFYKCLDFSLFYDDIKEEFNIVFKI
jgi:lipopolysaccharide assembly outer membrane protein LptD (OstA)